MDMLQVHCVCWQQHITSHVCNPQNSTAAYRTPNTTGRSLAYAAMQHVIKPAAVLPWHAHIALTIATTTLQA
jgi:hypothetical protein